MIDIATIPLAILYEDAEALVIDKPGGLPISRPRAGKGGGSERVTASGKRAVSREMAASENN